MRAVPVSGWGSAGEAVSRPPGSHREEPRESREYALADADRGTGACSSGARMSSGPSTRAYAAACWALSALFAARVLGQAVQRWIPQPFLPPVEAFQGSNLPYGLLLSLQLLILVVMVRVTGRVQTHRLVPSRRAGMWLAWLGAAYMAFALGRIAVGLAVPDAPAWFTAWIPALFHLVLAGFVLAISLYHLRETAPTRGEEP